MQVIVLGAGQAGLAAAYRAAKRGIQVTVLEGRETLGGIGGSFEIGGISVDYGSHRFHTACDVQVLHDLQELLGEDLLSRPKNSRLRLRGSWLHLPLRTSDLWHFPRGFLWDFASDLARAALQELRRSHTNGTKTFTDLLESDLGRSLCHDFYFPYVRKLWGIPPEQLAVPQAHQQRSGHFFHNIIRAGAATLLRRREAGADHFLYPRRGFGQIAQRYYEAACEQGAHFEFGARVTAIESDGQRVKSVRYEQGGQSFTLAAECIWSTLPITLLARCIEPQAPNDVLEAASGLTFRGLILIYLLLEQDRFTEYDTHFVPDAAIPITRISEPKTYSASTEPHGRTVLCIELPCDTDSDLWQMRDAALSETVCQYLDAIDLPVCVPIQEVVVHRLPRAFPIYRLGTDICLSKTDAWLRQFEGLLTFGLQGSFAHNDSHHILYMAYAAVECLGSDGVFNWERWSAFRETFDAQVAEFIRSMNGISL